MDKVTAKRVVIASPHGFCAGVVRAVACARQALQLYQGPIYCLNEIVHNEIVVAELRAGGIIFVNDLAEVPQGARVIFSAHGVTPAIRQAAAKASLRVIDATCPFVDKIHREVRHFAAAGYTVFVIGHSDHEEVVGITGEAPGSIRVLCTQAEAERVEPIWANGKTAVVTQTTLGVSSTQQIINTLQRRFSGLETQKHKDICYATENRQRAAEELCQCADLVLVLGSPNSSNTRRLFEIAVRHHPASAYMVSGMGDMQKVALAGHSTLGITAGASTPELFLEQVLGRLKAAGFEKIDTLKVAEENISLPLPAAMRRGA